MLYKVYTRLYSGPSLSLTILAGAREHPQGDRDTKPSGTTDLAWGVTQVRRVVNWVLSRLTLTLLRLFMKGARHLDFEKLREICGDYQQLSYAKGQNRASSYPELN